MASRRFVLTTNKTRRTTLLKHSLLLAGGVAVAVFCAPLSAQLPEDIGPQVDPQIVREITAHIQDAFSTSDYNLIINAYVLASASIHAPYELGDTISRDAAAALQMSEYMFKLVFVEPTMASDSEREEYARAIAAFVPRMASELEELAYEAERREDRTTLSRLAALVRQTVMIKVLDGGVPTRPKGGEAAVGQTFAFSGDGCEAECSAKRAECNADCAAGDAGYECRLDCGLTYSFCVALCPPPCERGNDEDGDGVDDCDDDDDGFGWWPY